MTSAGGAGTTGTAGTTSATGGAGTTGAAGDMMGMAGAGSAGTGAAGTGAAGTGAAGAAAPDAGTKGDAAVAGGAPGGTVACGTEKPDVSTITGSEGLVIGADGTIYFSQPSAVGRLRPGAASKPEKAWAKVTGSQVWGLAIDRANHVLYAGSPTTSTIYKVTLEDTPTVTNLVTMAGQPNGLTMGADGALYYSDFAAMGNIYRVTPDGTRTKVTTTPLAQPNGLAFGADGALYVDLFQAGSITKLTLAAGLETARADFVAKGLAPADDGLAFDAAGNAYVGYAGGVSRVSADGKMLTNLAKGGTANLEFGAGALDCKDIYYVTGGKLARVTNDVAGAAVPWHLP
jgi:sugar lactone lactonase YvrE